MKRSTRVIFTIYILLVMTIGVFIILAAFDPQIADTISIMVYHLNKFSLFTVIWIVAAALFILVGLGLLFFRSNKRVSGQGGSVVLQMADGAVTISLSAIEELARRYLVTVDGIIINDVKVTTTKEGLAILAADITCKPNVEIPKTTELINTGLKQYVEQYSGAAVSSCQLNVTPAKPAPPAVSVS